VVVVHAVLLIMITIDRIRAVGLVGGFGFGVAMPAFGALLDAEPAALSAHAGHTDPRVDPHGRATELSVPVSRSSTRRINGRMQTPFT
jgi:hypothetical protein